MPNMLNGSHSIHYQTLEAQKWGEEKTKKSTKMILTKLAFTLDFEKS